MNTENEKTRLEKWVSAQYDACELRDIVIEGTLRRKKLGAYRAFRKRRKNIINKRERLDG